ncbi:MAG TPA: endonuclease III [Steroidobacteraceae bacterium]|nr:endonuclease III [Steroidobacteraceae bacterium]
MHPSRVRAIFRRLQQANPHPTTELEYSTPFELLVAVMLSAHTTDKSVNTATRTLFPVANTPQAILALGVEGVKPYIKPAGMYNQKSKNLIELSRAIVEKHGGEIPHDRESLEALPGVGRKTANIILNMVFGESTIAVDTHIFRVANRTGLAEGKDPRTVEDQLNEVIPDEYKKDAHHWLILHGRYVCVARTPACPKCIIADLCEYPHKTPPKDLPKSEAPVAHAKRGTRAGDETLAAAGLASRGPARDVAPAAVRQPARSKSAVSATKKPLPRSAAKAATDGAAAPSRSTKGSRKAERPGRARGGMSRTAGGSARVRRD